MRSISVLAVLLAVGAFTTAPSIATDVYRHFPGTSVSLLIDDEYIWKSDVNGYALPDQSSFIIVTEFPAFMGELLPDLGDSKAVLAFSNSAIENETYTEYAHEAVGAVEFAIARKSARTVGAYRINSQKLLTGPTPVLQIDLLERTGVGEKHRFDRSGTIDLIRTMIVEPPSVSQIVASSVFEMSPAPEFVNATLLGPETLVLYMGDDPRTSTAVMVEVLQPTEGLDLDELRRSRAASNIDWSAVVPVSTEFAGMQGSKWTGISRQDDGADVRFVQYSALAGGTQVALTAMIAPGDYTTNLEESISRMASSVRYVGLKTKD